MRTSRISQETAKVIQSLSPNGSPRRSTRGFAKSLMGYSSNLTGIGDRNGRENDAEIKEEDQDDSNSSSQKASVSSADIEDIITTPSRKRKRGLGTRSTTLTSISTSTVTTSTRTSPRKVVKVEDSDGSPAKSKAPRRIPARKSTSEDGTVTIHPPSNWEELYSIVKAMRERNPTAPVDTMGCEDLFWQSSSPRDKRFQTLIALMLSSQTKDTVTAAAMKRLHTEMVPLANTDDSNKIMTSCLTLENILAVSPTHLNSLIRAVGFHNNKTKYIKAAALLIRDEYGSDIPPTVEGLIRLPGVGPKMAYLCMSAAWGKDEGIGVDVHVHRITNLWGWHKTRGPEESRLWLEGWLPRDKWHEINKMLVGLGQTVCLPVGRRCGECDLAGTALCKGEVRGWVKKEQTKRKRRMETVVEGDGMRDVGEVEGKVETAVKEELVDNFQDFEDSDMKPR